MKPQPLSSPCLKPGASRSFFGEIRFVAKKIVVGDLATSLNTSRVAFSNSSVQRREEFCFNGVVHVESPELFGS